MYIYGGWNSDTECYNDHLIFDAETNQIIQVQYIEGDEI
jgi:hypothetical protein